MGPRSSDRGYAGIGPSGIIGLRASMGPRSSDRGYEPEFPYEWGEEKWASMGPRSSDRGYGPKSLPPPSPVPASMGPRSSDRGYAMCVLAV